MKTATTAAATVAASCCTGCGICRAACPHGAIRMVPGRDLVARPAIDGGKCTSCGLCAKFCPNMPDKIAALAGAAAATRGRQPVAREGNDPRCFIAWDGANADGRKKSASGGIATALALRLLRDGRIDAVIHVKRVVSGRGKAHGAAALSRTPDEVENGRGSIYEPIDFSDVLLSLEEGGRYFMTGTPCVIRGVKALFAKHPRYSRMKLFTCALVCSHNVTPQFADYFADRKCIPRDAAYAVDFRDKTDIPDAGNFNTRYFKAGGADLFIANRNKCGWTRLWRSYAFALPICCKCPDFWCLDADISVKDAWGKKEWTADPLGKSVAVVRGAEMLEAFDSCGFEASALDPADVAKMQKPQLEYKLDAAKDKLAKSALAPCNIRNGHLAKVLTAWFSRTAYAGFGAGATAIGLRILAKVLASGGSAMKKKRKAMRTRTILVAGGYGYGNAGDEAQCAETLRLLAERYPRYQVRNLTPNPDFSFAGHPRFAHDYASRVMLYNESRRFDWFRLGSRVRKAGFLAASALAMLNAWFVKHGLPVWFINARKAAFLQQLSQCSLLYFCGGGYLTGATRSRLWDGIVLCRLASFFGVPVAMSGQTIGLWNGRMERAFARWGLRSVAAIGLRDDEASARDLADIGIAGERVMLTHDDALFCEKSPERQIEGRYIAVNFHYWGVSGARRAALLGQIRDALEKARRAVGVERVVFLAMHKSDLKSFEDYQNVYRDGALEAFPGAGRFREIRRAIADAEVLVTMKHHPVIFAVGEDTPVVSIAYSPYYVHKNFGAMQQYGVEACSTDMDSPDWPAQFDAALAKALDREWFAATVRARKEILKARKEAFMARIDAVVERSHA